MTLPYPPPYQDIRTLSEHICLSERTIETWVKLGKLPAPVAGSDGKRLWRWKDVEKHLAPERAIGTPSDDIERIREATRAAAARSH